MSGPSHWWRPKECRWTVRNLPLLDADPLLADTLELAGSPRVQELLAAHGGSVAQIFENLSEPERAELTRAMAAIRARHHQPEPHDAACPT